MAVYHVPQAVLAEFCTPEKPFMSFDEFGNIVKLYRDGRYAAENIKGFSDDIGFAYNLWTVNANSRYQRNLFVSEVPSGVYISLSIPSIEANASFPVCISVFDEEGAYFSQHQDIAVEKRIHYSNGKAAGHFRLVGWRKVASIFNFVISEYEKSANN